MHRAIETFTTEFYQQSLLSSAEISASVAAAVSREQRAQQDIGASNGFAATSNDLLTYGYSAAEQAGRTYFTTDYEEYLLYSVSAMKSLLELEESVGDPTLISLLIDGHQTTSSIAPPLVAVENKQHLLMLLSSLEEKENEVLSILRSLRQDIIGERALSIVAIRTAQEEEIQYQEERRSKRQHGPRGEFEDEDDDEDLLPDADDEELGRDQADRERFLVEASRRQQGYGSGIFDNAIVASRPLFISLVSRRLLTLGLLPLVHLLMHFYTETFTRPLTISTSRSLANSVSPARSASGSSLQPHAGVEAYFRQQLSASAVDEEKHAVLVTTADDTAIQAFRALFEKRRKQIGSMIEGMLKFIAAITLPIPQGVPNAVQQEESLVDVKDALLHYSYSYSFTEAPQAEQARDSITKAKKNNMFFYRLMALVAPITARRLADGYGSTTQLTRSETLFIELALIIFVHCLRSAGCTVASPIKGALVAISSSSGGIERVGKRGTANTAARQQAASAITEKVLMVFCRCHVVELLTVVLHQNHQLWNQLQDDIRNLAGPDHPSHSLPRQSTPLSLESYFSRPRSMAGSHSAKNPGSPAPTPDRDKSVTTGVMAPDSPFQRSMLSTPLKEAEPAPDPFEELVTSSGPPLLAAETLSQHAEHTSDVTEHLPATLNVCGSTQSIGDTPSGNQPEVSQPLERDIMLLEAQHTLKGAAEVLLASATPISAGGTQPPLMEHPPPLPDPMEHDDLNLATDIPDLLNPCNEHEMEEAEEVEEEDEEEKLATQERSTKKKALATAETRLNGLKRWNYLILDVVTLFFSLSTYNISGGATSGILGANLADGAGTSVGASHNNDANKAFLLLSQMASITLEGKIKSQMLSLTQASVGALQAIKELIASPCSPLHGSEPSGSELPPHLARGHLELQSPLANEAEVPDISRGELDPDQALPRALSKGPNSNAIAVTYAASLAGAAAEELQWRRLARQRGTSGGSTSNAVLIVKKSDAGAPYRNQKDHAMFRSKGMAVDVLGSNMGVLDAIMKRESNRETVLSNLNIEQDANAAANVKQEVASQLLASQSIDSKKTARVVHKYQMVKMEIDPNGLCDLPKGSSESNKRGAQQCSVVGTADIKQLFGKPSLRDNPDNVRNPFSVHNIASSFGEMLSKIYASATLYSTQDNATSTAGSTMRQSFSLPLLLSLSEQLQTHFLETSTFEVLSSMLWPEINKTLKCISDGYGLRISQEDNVEQSSQTGSDEDNPETVGAKKYVTHQDLADVYHYYHLCGQLLAYNRELFAQIEHLVILVEREMRRLSLLEDRVQATIKRQIESVDPGHEGIEELAHISVRTELVETLQQFIALCQNIYQHQWASVVSLLVTQEHLSLAFEFLLSSLSQERSVKGGTHRFIFDKAHLSILSHFLSGVFGVLVDLLEAGKPEEQQSNRTLPYYRYSLFNPKTPNDALGLGTLEAQLCFAVPLQITETAVRRLLLPMACEEPVRLAALAIVAPLFYDSRHINVVFDLAASCDDTLLSSTTSPEEGSAITMVNKKYSVFNMSHTTSGRIILLDSFLKLLEVVSLDGQIVVKMPQKQKKGEGTVEDLTVASLGSSSDEDDGEDLDEFLEDDDMSRGRKIKRKKKGNEEEDEVDVALEMFPDSIEDVKANDDQSPQEDEVMQTELQAAEEADQTEQQQAEYQTGEPDTIMQELDAADALDRHIFLAEYYRDLAQDSRRYFPLFYHCLRQWRELSARATDSLVSVLWRMLGGEGARENEGRHFYQPYVLYCAPTLFVLGDILRALEGRYGSVPDGFEQRQAINDMPRKDRAMLHLSSRHEESRSEASLRRLYRVCDEIVFRFFNPVQYFAPAKTDQALLFPELPQQLKTDDPSADVPNTHQNLNEKFAYLEDQQLHLEGVDALVPASPDQDTGEKTGGHVHEDPAPKILSRDPDYFLRYEVSLRCVRSLFSYTSKQAKAVGADVTLLDSLADDSLRLFAEEEAFYHGEAGLEEEASQIREDHAKKMISLNRSRRRMELARASTAEDREGIADDNADEGDIDDVEMEDLRSARRHVNAINLYRALLGKQNNPGMSLDYSQSLEGCIYTTEGQLPSGDDPLDEIDAPKRKKHRAAIYPLDQTDDSMLLHDSNYAAVLEEAEAKDKEFLRERRKEKKKEKKEKKKEKRKEKKEKRKHKKRDRDDQYLDDTGEEEYYKPLAELEETGDSGASYNESPPMDAIQVDEADNSGRPVEPTREGRVPNRIERPNTQDFLVD